MSTRDHRAIVAAGAVGVAVVLDATLREPPLSVHPVRAIGRYLHVVEKLVPSRPPAHAVAAGGVAWAAGAAGAIVGGRAIERLARRRGPAVRTVMLGAAMWPLFARRMLVDEAARVEDALAVSLADGRAAVSRLVSRDVSELTESQVRQAALESLAENLSDSVTAPLLWFGVGGLPAAALYRYANTADALWGYRTPRWKHAGMVAARADDLLNLVPARITALALILDFSRPRSRQPSRSIARTPGTTGRLRAEASRTPSPNAGWPMAALALQLGIRLAKRHEYELVADGREPTPRDTRDALRLVNRTAFGLAAGAAAIAAAVSGKDRKDRRWGRQWQR